MAAIGVFGAGGIVGRRVVELLVGDGYDVTVIAFGAQDRGPAAEGVRRRVVTDVDGLPDAMSGLDALVVATGDAAPVGAATTGSAAGRGPAGAERVGAGVRWGALRAAVDTATAVIDVDPEQVRIRDLVALGAGAPAPVVVGAGVQPAIGDVLASLAVAAVGLPVECHMAYVFPDGGIPPRWRGASTGRRASAAAVLGAPVVALEQGSEVDELPGEVRRLAWFPRPVGPMHAAAYAGGEAVTVPRHSPQLRTVRGYVAMSGWRAEVLQASANLARWPPARRRLRRRLTAPRPEPGPRRLEAMRWGCVAEVTGPDELARAWAYGHDPYRLTAAIAVTLAEASLGQRRGGVYTPAQLVDPAAHLDDLGRRTDLRWSISRP